MKYNTCTLSNGLRVIHLPSASPVVYCGYAIKAGTRDETDGNEGLAHFCEHATFKGTARRKAWHILNRLENVGGELNAFTNKEDTVYYSAILKEHLPRAVDLLTDMVFHSVYPQAEIEKEVEVICDEIESYNDSPSELIYDEFENLLFEGHPLGHNILGTAEKVRSYTTESALGFTRKHYIPTKTIFFAYGDADFRRLVKQLEAATSDLPHADETAVFRPETIHGAPLCTLSDKMFGQTLTIEKGTHQAHVMTGCRAYSIHHPRRMALYLLNNILGGPGMNARLNLSLRERHGLVYTADSSMASYGDTGAWCIYFGCDPKDTSRCLRLVRKELDKTMKSAFSETQLNKAKKQIKGQIGVACDNRESFALGFAKTFLHHNKGKDIDALYARIDAITPEDMLATAREVFCADTMTTLIYK